MKLCTTTSIVYVGIVEVHDDRYFVWFPDVPGAITAADDLDHLPSHAARALQLRLVWLEQHDEPIPEARDLMEILNDPVVRLSMQDGVDFPLPVSVELRTETVSSVVLAPAWDANAATPLPH